MATLKQLTTQYTAIGLYLFVIAVILPAIYLITTSDRPPVARNVVLVVAEGLSLPLLSEARAVHGEALFLDQLPVVGVTSASSAAGWPPDRAAMATVLATGRWGFPGHLNAWGSEPLLISHPTLLDIAAERGRLTGLITTDELVNPMIAAFGARVLFATDWNRILQDLILNAQPQLLLGGGRAYFNPPDHPEGSRRSRQALRELGVPEAELSEQLDYIARARAAGYTVVRNPADLSPTIEKKVLGLFTPEAFPFYTDREPPFVSLSLLVRFAVQQISKSDGGYFLVVHQGAIRRAALSHGADLSGDGKVDEEDARLALDRAVSEVLALDTTVRLLQKISSGQDTLLIVTGAMDWGGLALTVRDGRSVPLWTSPGASPMDMPIWAEGPGARELAGHHPLTRLFHTIERQLVKPL